MPKNSGGFLQIGFSILVPRPLSWALGRLRTTIFAALHYFISCIWIKSEAVTSIGAQTGNKKRPFLSADKKSSKRI